jgi:hypothetical protein
MAFLDFVLLRRIDIEDEIRSFILGGVLHQPI